MTEENTDRPIRVDAHHHFWPQPTAALYPWMTDQQAALRRPFGPDDLRPLLEAREFDWTVLVQTRSSLDETRDFLAIAEQTDFVAGVVGWVDLTAPDVDRVLTELKSTPAGRWLVGVRHHVHDEADRAWLLRSDVQRVVGWFGEDRLMFGSDWPVCTLAASYEQVHDALAETLTTLGLSDAAQAKIFGENARRFYAPGA
jgi:predicted TIM-barrel fold metal-dependent hydrolase